MAKRDVLNIWIELSNIHCHDEGDGWGNAEPYLWTVFFKIDGDTVSVTDSLTLAGSATVVTTPGSHGNLGNTNVDAGDNVPIPAAIGSWETILKPIPLPDFAAALGDIGGYIGCVVVLMEEDNVSDDGAEAGHAALNSAITSAINEIVATRSLTNAEVTDAEIDQMKSDVASAIASAIQAQQNFFENIWAWVNPDDQIGAEVFLWKADDLTPGTQTFNKRWTNEGDWELTGSITTSVFCPGELLEVLSNIFTSSAAASSMRSFRNNKMRAYKGLPEWWKLIERNTVQIQRAITEDPRMARAAVKAAADMKALLDDPDNRTLTDAQVKNVRSLLAGLKTSSLRRTRKDASVLDGMIGQLEGKKLSQSFEILSAIKPGRRPRLVLPLDPSVFTPTGFFRGIRPLPPVVEPTDP